MGLNNNYIKNLGSSKLAYVVNTSASTYVKEAGDPVRVGYSKNSTLDWTQNQDETSDQGGATFTMNGTHKGTFTINFMQRDLDTLNLNYTTLKNKIIGIVHQMNDEPIDGKYQFVVIPRAKPVPKTGVTLPGGELELQYNLESVPSLTTVSLGDFDDDNFSIAITGDVGIPAGLPFAYTEISAT